MHLKRPKVGRNLDFRRHSGDLERVRSPFNRYPRPTTPNGWRLIDSSCECIDNAEKCTACRDLLSQFYWRRSNLRLVDTPLYTDNDVANNDASLNKFIQDHWAPANPSAFYPNETGQEYCGSMFLRKLNDEDCAKRRGALCQTDTFNANISLCNSQSVSCSYQEYGSVMVDVISSTVVNTSVIMENVEINMRNEVNITVKGCYTVLSNASINVFVDKVKHNDVVFFASFECSNYGLHDINVHHNDDPCKEVIGTEEYNSKSLSILFQVSRCETTVSKGLVSFLVIFVIIIVIAGVSLLVFALYKTQNSQKSIQK